MEIYLTLSHLAFFFSSSVVKYFDIIPKVITQILSSKMNKFKIKNWRRRRILSVLRSSIFAFNIVLIVCAVHYIAYVLFQKGIPVCLEINLLLQHFARTAS